MPKEVYIVTDKAHEQYANYLRALISRTDDTPDAPVGAVDGSVSAVVWTEKQYEHNRPEFTSENYVVFIGNGKIIKSETAFMPPKFQKYGMCYRCLGRKAHLSAEKRLHSNLISPAKQKEFVAYCEEKKAALNIDSVSAENMVLDRIDSFVSDVRDTIFVQNLQYECLMRVFYLDYLRPFLGE